MAVDWGLSSQGLQNQFDGADNLRSLAALGAQQVQTQASAYKLRTQQRQDELRPLIAQRVGAGDYTGAAEQALTTGDTDSLAAIHGLHDDHLAQLDRETDALGSTAYQLRQIADPSQRAQAWLAAQPYLKQQGFSEDEILNANLSDAGLDGYITHAQGVKGAIQQAQQDRAYQVDLGNLGLRGREADLAERRQSFEENKPISVGFGTSLVTPGGRTVYDGSGMGGAAGGDVSRLLNSAAGGGNVPDSVQTLGQFVDYGRGLNQRGAKSSSAGTYQINGSTMAEFGPKALGPGWQAAPFNAESQDKVGEAIFNWAKAQPNPAAALRGRWVSLDANTASQLVKGNWQQARGIISQGETGGGIGASAAGGQGGAGGLTAQALDFAAQEAIANGGKVPSGYARNRAAQAAITNRVAAIAASQGKSVQQVIQEGQTTGSQGKSYQTWNSGKAGTGAAQVRSLSVATDHLDQLGIAAQALHNGSTPLFNRLSQAYAQQTGSAIPTNFDAIKGFVADEAVKAIVGSGGGVGDREEAKSLVSRANSPQQLAGAIKSIQGLMAGQLHGLRQQYEQTTGRQDFDRYVSPRAKRVLEGGSSAPASPAGWKITRVG